MSPCRSVACSSTLWLALRPLGKTIDYLADTWAVFVAQVKSMWNSTVGFLRKAWIKLKSLFDDDVNVEVEMAKIDKEIRTADEAEENKKQRAIADRMKRRDARKQQIESNRVQMQEGIKQQLEERRKARAGRDIDGEMAVIDQETEAKNQNRLMRPKRSSSSKTKQGSHATKDYR